MHRDGATPTTGFVKRWLVASLLLNALLVGVGLFTLSRIPVVLEAQRAGRAERLGSQFAIVHAEPGKVVFVGDSITQGGLWSEIYASADVLNRGVGGDTTAHLLARAGEIHALAPRKLFVMIGINDLNRGVARAETFTHLEQLFDGFDREIPETEIYLQSVLPVNDDWRISIRPSDIDAINQKLVAEAAARGYTFVDLRPAFTAADGQLRRSLSNDGIHLLGEGYAVWRAALAQQGIDVRPAPATP